MDERAGSSGGCGVVGEVKGLGIPQRVRRGESLVADEGGGGGGLGA